MRVIAGELRSRRLRTVPGADTRPTPDRLRETLFNIISARIAGSVFLDAYAGTGAVGIEALSRGAARAIFIERARQAAMVIRQNLADLGVGSRAEILEGRALQYLPHRTADIVFLDPPYALVGEYEEALNLVRPGPGSLVIVQHDCRLELHDRYNDLYKKRVVKQGDNRLSFFESADLHRDQ